MNFSFSNLAWPPSLDSKVAALLRAYGCRTIDIVPSKYFDLTRDTNTRQVSELRRKWESFGIEIQGMQSLLFGIKANIFDGPSHRDAIADRIRKICHISRNLGVTKITFGSPSNRQLGIHNKEAAEKIAGRFFASLADSCSKQGVVICLEPAPQIYGGDFLVSTSEVLDFITSISHPHLRLQLDSGAAILEDKISDWRGFGSTARVGHIHISSPGLRPIDSTQTMLKPFIQSAFSLGAEFTPTLEMLTSCEGSAIVEIEKALVFMLESLEKEPAGLQK